MLNHQEQQKQKQSYRVIHDMQTGRYYKVHNQLGKEVKVNRDGSPLTQFKAGISGHKHDNKLKIHNYSTTSNRYHSWLSKEGVQIGDKAKINRLNTIQCRRKANYSEQRLNPYASFSLNNKSNTSLNKHANRDLKLYSRLANYSSTQKPVRQFEDVLKSYNQIINNRLDENYSFKKQQIPGGIKLSKLQSKRLVGRKDCSNTSSLSLFNSINTLPKDSSRIGKLNKRTLDSLPQSLSVRRQYLKDKELYYSIHPDRKIVQKPFNNDRRINLKKLQDESIKQNQMKTMKIYETIEN